MLECGDGLGLGAGLVLRGTGGSFPGCMFGPVASSAARLGILAGVLMGQRFGFGLGGPTVGEVEKVDSG